MRLFVFGLGYTAQALIRTYRHRFSGLSGTVRTSDKAASLRAGGIAAHALEACDEAALMDDLRRADAVLVSAAPSDRGDPILERFGDTLARASHRLSAGHAWIGYLSTVGVYGDHGGAWIDETTPPEARSRRGRERVTAEAAWRDLGQRTGQPVHVFRLAGIYGPGRNALVKLARGEAHRIIKPGQVFNRIHVDDIASVLMASMSEPQAGAIYNVSDDEPGPPQDVIAYAAGLAGIAPPPEIPFESAHLSPMARSFYADNRRVSNRLIRRRLGVDLRYPTYREGLQALYAQGEFTHAA
jgi:nucleoside-diphosphate-sugar epimerase